MEQHAGCCGKTCFLALNRSAIEKVLPVISSLLFGIG